jgi:hypothetical protein
MMPAYLGKIIDAASLERSPEALHKSALTLVYDTAIESLSSGILGV